MEKVINQSTGQGWSVYHGDCIDTAASMPENSIDYTLYSPPFQSLYTYSSSPRDLGNCRDAEEFFEHFTFLARELLRITRPGRLMSFHCMNLSTSKTHHGYIGLQDFRGDLIRIFLGNNAAELYKAIQAMKARALIANIEGDENRFHRVMAAARTLEEDLAAYPGEQGFIYHSEVVIWKDPVTAMQRTKALGLLYKQLCKDSAMSRQGVPDYLVTMRKPGTNENPISSETKVKFDGYIGDEPPETTTLGYRHSIDVWQRYASPVWFDINPSNTLQYTTAREEQDERHICPLQLQVIERGVELWSNPNDVVLDPFAGIGSTGYVAVKKNRRFIGVELKESYWTIACRNLRDAEQQNRRAQIPLFTFAPEPEESEIESDSLKSSRN